MQSRVAPLVSIALFSILLGVACEPLDDSGEPGECELLEDEDVATATPTTITIENVGDVPLFLHDEADRNDLLWFFVDGELVIDDLAFPLLRCAGADQNLDEVCAEEPLFKPNSRLVRLEPGATLEIPWDAYVWDSVEIDDSCFGGPLCGVGPVAHCQAGRVVEIGSQLELRAAAFTGCSLDGSDCPCPADATVCEFTIDSDGPQPELTGHSPFELDLEFTGAPIVIEIGG